MPSSSKKQHNFMAAVAKNPDFAKKAGVPSSVGSDFIKADKGRTFGKGGKNMAKPMPMFGGKESYAEEMKEAKAIKSGKITPQQYAKAEGKEKTKPKQTSFAIGGAIPSFGRGIAKGMNRYRPNADVIPPSLARGPGPMPGYEMPGDEMRTPNRMPGDEPTAGRMPPPPMSAAGANYAAEAARAAQMREYEASPPPQLLPTSPTPQDPRMAKQQMLAQRMNRFGRGAPPPPMPAAGRMGAVPSEDSPFMPMGPAPAFKKGGFIKSADGVASKGKTKAQQFSSGGRVSSRADGIATKGKTRGKMC